MTSVFSSREASLTEVKVYANLTSVSVTDYRSGVAAIASTNVTVLNHRRKAQSHAIEDFFPVSGVRMLQLCRIQLVKCDKGLPYATYHRCEI